MVDGRGQPPSAGRWTCSPTSRRSTRWAGPASRRARRALRSLTARAHAHVDLLDDDELLPASTTVLEVGGDRSRRVGTVLDVLARRVSR
ncbi:hypothetical protein [Phycicoccus jejuensis]|uniref:hypothetical protein n=1 Tax=Phycicoccus jejuensis TaxID=367299 RepID=UPI000B20870A|nr:hypothetical protein [Phycicoccus jejuensis]